MGRQQRKRECPTCGWMTVCTVEFKPAGAPHSAPSFHPHNNPTTGEPCPQSGHSRATRRYNPGDRVYRYVWVGGEDHDPQPLTVARVNRETVTVHTDEGTRLRIDPVQIVGFWTET